MTVRKFLFANGFRYRLHDKSLLGKPDIVLKKYKSLIFINDCFWHGHENCKYFSIPKTRTEWWREKILKNIKKDAFTVNELIRDGWRVIVIWECQLKKNILASTFEKLTNDIRKV